MRLLLQELVVLGVAIPAITIVLHMVRERQVRVTEAAAERYTDQAEEEVQAQWAAMGQLPMAVLVGLGQLGLIAVHIVAAVEGRHIKGVRGLAETAAEEMGRDTVALLIRLLRILAEEEAGPTDTVVPLTVNKVGRVL